MVSFEDEGTTRDGRCTRPAPSGAGAAKDGELKLHRGTDGQLRARIGRTERAVRVHRCFPWSDPGQFLSLRDQESEREVALVASIDDLEPESRRVLTEALEEAGFVLQVTGIDDVEEEIEIRTWRVETRQGERTFQTRLDDWPVEVPGGGVVIRDVAGDLYHVTDPHEMDAKSRRWLWAFVD